MTEQPTAMSPSDPALFRDSQIERLWNWLLHEGNLFNSRQQLFAVAEAMLLGAYATLTAAAAPQLGPVVVLIAAGALSCLFWLYANYHQLERTIGPLRAVLVMRLGEYVYVRSQSTGRLRTTIVMGYAFPFVLLLLWAVLFVMHADQIVPPRPG